MRGDYNIGISSSELSERNDRAYTANFGLQWQMIFE